MFDHARRTDIRNLLSILTNNSIATTDVNPIEVVVEGERRMRSVGEKAVLDSGLRQERQSVDQVRVRDSEGVVLVAERVDFFERVLEVSEAHSVAVVELLVLEDEAGLVETGVRVGDDVVVVVVEGAVGRGEGEGGGGSGREHWRGVVAVE